jgi:hypothetical protein
MPPGSTKYGHENVLATIRNEAMTRKSLPTAQRNFESLQRYLAERDGGGSRQPKQAAKQPIRFDGSSHPMPKLKGGGDEFHTLRNKAASATGRYGKK